jgi:hypothetical protein
MEIDVSHFPFSSEKQSAVSRWKNPIVNLRVVTLREDTEEVSRWPPQERAIPDRNPKALGCCRPGKPYGKARKGVVGLLDRAKP